MCQCSYDFKSVPTLSLHIHQSHNIEFQFVLVTVTSAGFTLSTGFTECKTSFVSSAFQLKSFVWYIFRAVRQLTLGYSEPFDTGVKLLWTCWLILDRLTWQKRSGLKWRFTFFSLLTEVRGIPTSRWFRRALLGAWIRERESASNDRAAPDWVPIDPLTSSLLLVYHP